MAKDPVLHDVTLNFGFLQALAYVMRIKHKGLAWLAVPCNSFSFMSISQHCRSWLLPYGRPFFGWVHLGNIICSRSCLLVAVAICRSVTYFVENPLRSTVQYWPYLNTLMHIPSLNSHRTSWYHPQLVHAG